MVRGLVTRQIFVLLDLALVVFCVGTFGAISVRFLANEDAVKIIDVPVDSEAMPAGELPKMAALTEYSVIQSSGLFGPAGKWDPNSKPAEPPAPIEDPTDDVPETELNLKLTGVVALEPTGPFSSAAIEDTNIRDSRKVFFVGQEVSPQVELLEVHDRLVFLLNRRKVPHAKERLSMDEEEEQLAVAKLDGGGQPSREARSAVSERINLNRAEITAELYDSYADLVTKIKPEVVRDENGDVLGITAKNIEQVPLAEKLGISEGDILQTVNNEKIDSQQKIMEMVQKYQSASSFRIGIQRDGKPKIITYRLN
ncbi:MAG: hypothetical protein HYV27_21520 [Candidatus Hydrogenedentes bacterium]|nr:hypothetical protein [Candidatus Hydrogenedentota bacterium]